MSEDGKQGPDQPLPGDEVAPGSAQSAEDRCRRCGGTGKRDGARCEDCAGSGRVTVLVGDA